MWELASIATIPILLAVAAMLLPVKVVKVAAPVAIWLQLLQVINVVRLPVFGAQPFVALPFDFRVDQLGGMFMLLTTVVVASCLSHAYHYFKDAEHEDMHLRVFYASASLFLLAMTTVFMCDNLGALWISVEATTLTSAPLVYFDRTKNAIEATWKYLIICSVGIAFALLGTILFFASSQQGSAGTGSLSVTYLIQHVSELNFQLARLGAIFCLLGYGTKAGMFPVHNWLPDAHSEAPAPASAMLSGSLLNCALFAIWRITQIMSAAQSHVMITEMLIVMGAVTALAASLMLIKQHSFKRMWAYSSIENVGIILVAMGLGSGILFFLQALNHSIAKVALFLVTGNVVQASGTKRLSQLHGVIATAPAWGILLLLGTFAVTGAPPFGMFVSELFILVHSATASYWAIAATLLLAVSISFVAISSHVGRIICGSAKPGFVQTAQFSSSLMPGLLIFCSLLLGIAIGPSLWVHLK